MSIVEEHYSTMKGRKKERWDKKREHKRTCRWKKNRGEFRSVILLLLFWQCLQVWMNIIREIRWLLSSGNHKNWSFIHLKCKRLNLAVRGTPEPPSGSVTGASNIEPKEGYIMLLEEGLRIWISAWWINMFAGLWSCWFSYRDVSYWRRNLL